MAKKTHRLRSGNPLRGQLGDNGRSRTMKSAGQSDFLAVDSLDEVRPVVSSPDAGDLTGGGVPRISSASGKKLSKEGNKVGMHRGRMKFSCFGVESDSPAFEVQIVNKMNSRLESPTSLVNGDFERDVKHVFNGRVLNLGNLSSDEIDVIGCEGLLSLGGVFPDTEPDTRICGNDSATNCLLHENPKNVDFVQCGVVAGFPTSIRRRVGCAPSHIIEAMLAHESFGAGDFLRAQEQGQRLPAVQVKAGSPVAVGISQSNPVRHPGPTRSASSFPTSREFFGGSLGFQGASLTNFDGEVFAVSEASRNIPAFKVSVHEGNPIVIPAFVKISHSSATQCSTGERTA